MEREKELIKLINVLRRTSRMALQSEWTGGKEDAAAFCTDQYNRVLTRLKELDPGVGTIFEPLPAGSSLTVVAMASRQLAAYYEVSAPRGEVVIVLEGRAPAAAPDEAELLERARALVAAGASVRDAAAALGAELGASRNVAYRVARAAAEDRTSNDGDA